MDGTVTSRCPRRLVAIVAIVAGTLVAALAAGCTHLGPRTVAVDRYDYSVAIADSWKRQTLLNIVKLRYLDLPVFVDVASVVAGYSLQTGVNVGGTLSSERGVQGDFATAGAQAIYTDRPTTTYVPLTGERFLRGLITPIDPKNIFFMVQTGYAADFILALSVESLNGVRNRSITAGAVRNADPEFLRALQLMREVQASGAFGMRVEETRPKGSAAVVFFRHEDAPADVLEKLVEIRRVLKLPPDQQKYVLTYSPVRGGEGELAVNSRSMLQILFAFATYVDVPKAHLDEHRAVPVSGDTPSGSGQDVVRIRSGREQPADAYVAVFYRGHWFWIDDGDWQTKRALSAVMFFFTLGETGGTDKLPQVTIPAQ
jgi:hypothetical protein